MLLGTCKPSCSSCQKSCLCCLRGIRKVAWRRNGADKKDLCSRRGSLETMATHSIPTIPQQRCYQKPLFPGYTMEALQQSSCTIESDILTISIYSNTLPQTPTMPINVLPWTNQGRQTCHRRGENCEAVMFQQWLVHGLWLLLTCVFVDCACRLESSLSENQGFTFWVVVVHISSPC